MQMDGVLDFPYFLELLFLGEWLLLEIGYRAGYRFSSSARNQGVMQLIVIRPIGAVIFVLFGVMLAFMTWSASGHMDHRRELAAQEIVAIRTAYLRMDLLPAERQSAARALFR